MMKRYPIALFLGLLFLFTQCVTTKVFNDLEARYAVIKKERNAFEQSKDSLQKVAHHTTEQWEKTSKLLLRARDSVNKSLEQIESLEKEYDLLQESSEAKIRESIAVNNSLLREIALKKTELEQRSDRVDQLETMMEEQKKALTELKERLKDALLNFEGKGLTVEQRNGKVYVSMENKLLFKSGSWDIESEGIMALRELAKVLSENPDITILIEGHTDNVPFTPSGPMVNNWDLSTKRATAVVSVLMENENILPQNLTAAGRSEYLPIASNREAEGRAANRRIEVILSPSFEEISELLESKNN